MAQNILFTYAGRFGGGLHKSTLGRQVAVQGQHIFLCVVLVTVVCLTVHVDGEIRDQYKVTVYVHQSGYESSGIRILDDHASCHGEWAVKPGSAEHAAVTFNIEANIVTVCFKFGVLLYFESRRIPVTCYDAHPFKSVFRYGKCEEGRAVAGDEISAAGLYVPFPVFLQLFKMFLRQDIFHIFYCMEAGRAAFQKLCKIF